MTGKALQYRYMHVGLLMCMCKSTRLFIHVVVQQKHTVLARIPALRGQNLDTAASYIHIHHPGGDIIEPQK